MKLSLLYIHILLSHSQNTYADSTSASITTTSLNSISSSSTTSSVWLSNSTTLNTSTTSLSSSTSSITLSSNGVSTSILPSQTLDPGTAADIETIRTRRLATILGGITGTSNISTWLTTQNTDLASPGLGSWPDVVYLTGCAAQRANWPAEEHFNRLLTMAGAWHGGVAGAGQYAQDAALHSAISIGMDWWFARDLTNPACLDSGGTPACPCNANETQMFNTNWFSNIIGVPELVSAICLLLNDTLSTSQLNNCTHMTGRSYATFGTNINGVGQLTGANTLDVAKIGLDLAILTVNSSLVIDAYRQVHNELQIHPAVKADGIRPDGSFGQHGGLLYNGNYGKDYTNDLLDLEHEASQTQFAANETSKTAFSTLFDGSRWMIYSNSITKVLHWDLSALGRFISFPVIDKQATGSININLTKVAQLGQEWGASSLVNFAQSLSNPSSTANAGGLTGNRMFYDNDYMVHRGHNYVSTVKMYSSRTRNSECTNSQNPKGFHLSDGAEYTLLRGDEYEDIAAAWDWYLIPGITVDYGATPLDCKHVGYNGVESFVGGVSDGLTGIAVMRYTNPDTQSLRFQKAWFFLDDDLQHIMIAGITSSTDAPVYSVLDQRRYNGFVLLNDLGMDTSEQVRNLTGGVQSLWHGGVGYTFGPASDMTLSVQVGEKTGSWSAIGISTQPPATVDLFAAWITHNPLNTSVAYTAFPGTDPISFQTKKRNSKIQSIRNDESVSAVSDPVHHKMMVVFWDAAGGAVEFPSLTTTLGPVAISADGAVTILFNTKTGDVTVSDPSQELQAVVVTIVWHGNHVKSMVFALPEGGVAGSSVTQNIQDF